MTTSALMAAAETLASVATSSPQPTNQGLAPTGKTSGSAKEPSEPKKRTRPVSACEACRAKKVRCILTPDAPVCQNCLSSGKECLFRVDDLAPALRAARFSHFGPPSANARTIPAKKTKGARKSTDDGDSKRPRQRRKTLGDESGDGKGATASGETPSGTPGPKVKAKAVFRSFANPTNLAAPLPVSAPPANGSAPAPNMHGAPPTVLQRGRSSTSSNGYAPPIAQHDLYSGPSPIPGGVKMPQYGESSTRLLQQRNDSSDSFSHDASYYGHPTAGDAGPERRTGTNAAGFFLQQPSPSENSHGSAKSRPARDGAAYNQSLYSDQKSAREEHGGASGSGSAKQKRSQQANGGRNQPGEDVDPMSLAYYGHLLGVDGVKAEGKDPTRPDIPGQREGFEHDGRGSPRPTVSAELRDGIERWQRNGNANGRGFADETAEAVEEAPASKPKILLPFFRWFGTTANTPGYRKIKVGVLQDSEVADTDDLGPVIAEDQAARKASFTLNDEHVMPDPMAVAASAASGPLGSTPASAAAAAAAAAMTVSSADLHRSPQPLRPPSPGSKGEKAPSSVTRELFEINRPRYPRRDILEHLVSVFLSHFKPSWCPWIDADELRGGAENGSLPAILANAICAVAARFSDRAELRRSPRKSSGDHFSEMAKILIMPLLSFPSMEVIETLILLSYAEFAAGSDSGLWMYVGMALRMAQDLGLQHEASVTSIPNEKHQEKARLMFWAIVGLDRITTFGTGRPVTIRESEIDTELPKMNESSDTNDETVIFGHCIRILMLRGRMGELLNRRGQDDSYGVEDRKRALAQMWMELAQSYSSLPSNLHFNVQTFQRAAAQNQSPGFVYLHVLFQSTIGLLDRPALMKKFTGENSAPLLPSFAPAASGAASRTISDILTLGDAFDDRCITASPYLDQLILPAGRSFLAEREAAREALRQLGMGSRPPSRGPHSQVPSRTSSLSTTKSYADINLAACQRILHKLQVYWAGASWPMRALEQEAAGKQDEVDPQASDEDAQSAPIRDVEMVLKWAKSKLRSQRKMGESATNTPRFKTITMPDGREVRQPYGTSDGEPTSTHSGDSPFGLGLGISADLTFDIDALMEAWQVDEGFGHYNAAGGPAATPYASNQQPQTHHQPQQPDFAPSGELLGPPPSMPRRNGNIASLLNGVDGNGAGAPAPAPAPVTPYNAPTPAGILPGNVDISGMAVAEFFSSDQSVWPLQLQSESFDEGNFAFLASALQIPHQ